MKGVEGFHQFFREVYRDRWKSIYSALEKEDKKVLRRVLNRCAQYPGNVNIPLLEKHIWSEAKTFDLAQEIDENQKLCFYAMDPASIIVALMLEVQPGHQVLDLCAAPGGKSLILSEALLCAGSLMANEPSPPRRSRLKKVFAEYLPDELLERISVIGMDGVSVGMKYLNHFDSVLVDAPCSGERHMVKKTGELAKWSLKRSKRLAGTQYGLLCSALLAAKPGGKIVYSTCALCPLENDGVIEKLLKKKSDQFVLDEVQLPADMPAERTEFGYLFYPDKCGFGPLFFSRLVRI